MLVDRGQRRQVESPADFLQARGVAVVLDEFVQVIEDFTLPFREREHFIPPVFGRDGQTIMRTEGENQIGVWDLGLGIWDLHSEGQPGDPA
jgi:hypothetical protein